MPTSETIQLPFARLSFPRLWKPRSYQEGQEPRYEASFLLDPSNAAHQKKISEIQQTAESLIKEVCKGEVPDDVKYCFGIGGKKYEGYQDMFWIASHKKAEDGRITVVNAAGTPVDQGEPQSPYAGCYVHGTITLWGQNNKWGRRVNCNLRAVKFMRDGAAFTAVRPVDLDTEFDDTGDDPSFSSFGNDPLED